MPSQLALAVGLALGAVPPVILANPTGAVVVHGQAQFAAQGNRLTVTNSPNAIIHWRGFSIGAGELTRFQQQSATSAVLNRVVGADPSSILGTLSSNGRVFLINPNGIVFGAGSVIDTQGFLASTLNIADRDFLEGRLRFEGAGGAIRNYGAISGGAGDVFLIAPSVTNAGAITSQGGRVVLAAGQKVEIGTTGLEGIRFEVQAPTDEALNLGRLEGGAVGLFAGSLKHSGDIRATTLAREGGKIVLKAAGYAIVEGGSLTASGSKGGEVQVLGNRVGLAGAASIDTSGTQGGGTVLVGGDFRGGNPEVPNAAQAHVGREASIRADATAAGDGGRVIVWSDEVTRVQGEVSARGGPQGGDGGFVEISGRRHLEFAGRVDTRAPAGRAGTLLLDPQDLVLNDGPDAFGAGAGFSGGLFASTEDASSSTISWGTLLEQLAGGNVILTTSDANPSDGAGDITVQTGRSFGSANSLSLLGHRSVVVNGAIANQGSGALSFVAGWDGASISSPATSFGIGNIAINAPVTAEGPISLTAGGILQLANTIKSAAAINVQSLGVEINQPVSRTSLDAGAGTLTVSSLGGVDVRFGADAGSADLVANKFVVTRGGGGVIRNTTTFGPVRTKFNQLDIQYQGSNGPNAEVYISNNEGAAGPLEVTGLDLATVVGLPAIRTRIENKGDLLVTGPVQARSGNLSLRVTDPAGQLVIANSDKWLTAAGTLALAANRVEIGSPVSASTTIIQATVGINLGLEEAGRLSLTGDELGRLTTDRLTLTGLDLLVNNSVTSGTILNLITGSGMPVVVNQPLTLSQLDSGVLFAAPRLDINAGVSAGTGGIQVGGDGIGALLGIPDGSKPRNPNTVELSNAELRRFGTTGAVIIGGNFSEGGPAAMKQMGPVDLTGVTQRLVLQGDGITQAPGATLAVPQLGVRSSGDVALGEANAIERFAAQNRFGNPINITLAGGTPEAGLTVTSLDTATPNFGFLGISGIGTTGNVSLASSGKMLQDASIRANRLDLRAQGGIALTNDLNQASALNVSGAGGDVAFTNFRASQLSVLGISGVTGNITLTSTVDRTMSLDGPVEVASGKTLAAMGGPLAVGAAGTLRGFGTVDVTDYGVPLQVDGTIAPGNAANTGTLAVRGNVAFGSPGKLAVRLAGTNAGQFDRLSVSGNAALDGTLRATLDGYAPVAGDTFPVLTFGTRTGSFATHDVPANVVHTYNLNDLTLSGSGAAAGIFWDNQTGNFLWTDPLNWSLDRLPGTTDDVTVTAGAGSLVNLNSGDHFIQSLLVGSSKNLSIDSASLTVSGAATVDGSLTLGSLGRFSANGTASIASLSHRGTIDGKGSVSVGAMAWRDGGTVRGSAPFAVNGALTLGDADHGKVGPRPLVLDGRSVQANGAVTHESQSLLQIGSGGRFNANAGYAVSDGAIASDDLSSFNLGSTAIFAKTGLGRFDISGPFNTGAGSKFNVASGQVVLASGFSKLATATELAGRFDVAAGAALDFTSGEYRFADTALVSNAGVLRLAGAGLRPTGSGLAHIDNLAGARVDLAGTNSVGIGVGNAGTLSAVAASPYGEHVSSTLGAYNGSGEVDVVGGLLDMRGANTVISTASVQSAGTLALNGTGAHSIGNLNLMSGVLEGSGSVSVGAMLWRDGGTVRGSGAFAVNGALILGDADHGKVGPRPLVLDGRSVQANGAVIHESQSMLQINNAGQFNANGSYAATDGSIIVSDDTSRFNLGPGAGFTKSGIGQFNISGLLNTAAGSKFQVQGGQLVLASGFSKFTAETELAGRFDAAAGAALDFTSGTYRFADTALVSNAGVLRIANSDLRLGPVATGLARIDNLAGARVDLAGNNSVGIGIGNAGTLAAVAASPYGEHVFSNFSRTVAAAAGSMFDVAGGTVALGQSFSNEGLVNVAAGATLRQAAGTLTNASAGTLTGSGTIDVSASGTPLQNAGTIAPSGQRSLAGTLTVQGDLAMAPTSRLLLDQRPGDSDQLAVTGQASLDGTLQFTPLPLFVAGEDTGITAVTFGSRTGTFATVSAPPNLHPVYPNGRVDLVYSPFAPTIVWDNSSGDGQWSNPLNWSVDRLPDLNDDVLVNLPGSSTVTHATGGDALGRLYLGENLAVTGGSLITLGAVNHGAGQTLHVANGSAFDTTASYNVTSGSITTSGDSRFTVASGTFRKSGPDTFTVAGSFGTRAGATVAVDGGRLVMDAGSGLPGTWAVLQVIRQPDITRWTPIANERQAGLFQVAAGAELSFLGLAPALPVTESTTLGPAPTPATPALSSWSFEGAGRVENAGTVLVSGELGNVFMQSRVIFEGETLRTVFDPIPRRGDATFANNAGGALVLANADLFLHGDNAGLVRTGLNPGDNFASALQGNFTSRPGSSIQVTDGSLAVNRASQLGRVLVPRGRLDTNADSTATSLELRGTGVLAGPALLQAESFLWGGGNISGRVSVTQSASIGNGPNPTADVIDLPLSGQVSLGGTTTHHDGWRVSMSGSGRVSLVAGEYIARGERAYANGFTGFQGGNLTGFVAGGTFRKQGAGTFAVNAPMQVNHQAIVEAGTLAIDIGQGVPDDLVGAGTSSVRAAHVVPMFLGTTTIQPAGTLSLKSQLPATANLAGFEVVGTIDNSGRMFVTGPMGLPIGAFENSGGVIRNRPGATLGLADVTLKEHIVNDGTVTFDVPGAINTSSLLLNSEVSGSGTLFVNSGTVTLTPVLRPQFNQFGVVVALPPDSYRNTNRIEIAGGARLRYADASITFAGQNYSINPGVDSRFPFVNEAGGTISGRGTLELLNGGARLQNFGTLSPGTPGAAGFLDILGNLENQPGGRLAVDLAGAGLGEFDKLLVSGTARFETGGIVQLGLLNGYAPPVGSRYEVLLTGGGVTLAGPIGIQAPTGYGVGYLTSFSGLGLSLEIVEVAQPTQGFLNILNGGPAAFTQNQAVSAFAQAAAAAGLANAASSPGFAKKGFGSGNVNLVVVP